MVELIVLIIVILVGITIGIRRYKKITKVNLAGQELIFLIKPENVEMKTSEQWVETQTPLNKNYNFGFTRK
jgi:hypothetical protein